MKLIFSLLACFLFMIGCSQYDEKLLVGKWQASSITQGGELLEIDYSPISFEFFDNGFYTFNSTIEYKEAGNYYLNGNLLYTTDTLNTASTEKAVQIVDITQDSLVLKMMANDKAKIMKLYKSK